MPKFYPAEHKVQLLSGNPPSEKENPIEFAFATVRMHSRQCGCPRRQTWTGIAVDPALGSRHGFEWDLLRGESACLGAGGVVADDLFLFGLSSSIPSQVGPGYGHQRS